MNNLGFGGNVDDDDDDHGDADDDDAITGWSCGRPLSTANFLRCLLQVPAYDDHHDCDYDDYNDFDDYIRAIPPLGGVGVIFNNLSKIY